MRDEPTSLGRDLIASTLAERWGIDSAEIAYLPVGGGGHHWRVLGGDSLRWFVTASGLTARGHWLESDGDAIYARTNAAYETARQLDREFVLAAVPDRQGSLLYRLHTEWALSVYPYLDSAETVGEKQLTQTVAGFIGELHAVSPPVGVPRWRSDLPQRWHLEDAIATPGQSAWLAGPYGNPTGELLIANNAGVLELVNRYDQLAAVVANDAEPWVLTHGEPHAGNTLQTTDGTTYLIDWDSVALAPRERDLWQLLDAPAGPVWDSYQAKSGHGRNPHPAIIEFFRLWWRLAEIGSYVRQFRAPHSGNADDDAAWKTLESCIG